MNMKEMIFKALKEAARAALAALLAAFGLSAVDGCTLIPIFN